MNTLTIHITKDLNVAKHLSLVHGKMGNHLLCLVSSLNTTHEHGSTGHRSAHDTKKKRDQRGNHVLSFFFQLICCLSFVLRLLVISLDIFNFSHRVIKLGGTFQLMHDPDKNNKNTWYFVWCFERVLVSFIMYYYTNGNIIANLNI